MAGSRTSTLSAIAGDAGVSVSAVSKVLNGGGTDVAAGTRARIARLLRQHGYQVASQTGFAVADLLIGCLDSPWAEELTRGAVEAAAEADVSVIVTMVTSSAGFGRWLDLASRRGTGGALCVLQLPGSQELQRLAAARIPLVVIDPPEEPGAAIRSVGTTNWQGGVQATRHLIDLGHRRIGVIAQEAVWSGRARLAGYRAAMLEAGLGVDGVGVCCAEFTAAGGWAQGATAARVARCADGDSGGERRSGVRRASGAGFERPAGSRRCQRDGIRRSRWRPGPRLGC